MRSLRLPTLIVAVGMTGLAVAAVAGAAPTASESPCPCAIAASPDANTLYVAAACGRRVLFVDASKGKIKRSVELPARPTDLILSAKGDALYVTCAGPKGRVCKLDTKSGKVLATIGVGHTARGPVLAPDGKTLYVCNQFNDSVSVIDLAKGKELTRIPVLREPFAGAVSPDGKTLVVANLLPVGRSDQDVVTAAVSLVDTNSRKVVANVALPNGSMSVRGVGVSPDGKLAFVSHILGRFHMPTTQLERGWMNTNALSLIDLPRRRLLNTVLLDDVDQGAANPWGLAVTADGKRVLVAHAGTHELSIVDVPGVLAKLAKLPEKLDPKRKIDYTAASRVKADVPNDLSFLVDLRRRIRLPGVGPRAVAVRGARAWVAERFSNSISVVDLDAKVRPVVQRIQLGPAEPTDPVRRGEMLFGDARLCFQGWQSCLSCHPEARVDGLNWDLMNDGMGNPKNTRSLLLSHRTPPVMSLGVRPTAETAVRSGITFIQFAVRPESDAAAIDAYLKSLEPVASPHLVDGKLSPAAQRGRKLFFSPKVGCSACHPPKLYTDLKMHDVGTKGRFDRKDAFDNPSLVEVWRTAPYMHDGQCATVLDVLTSGNRGDRHGKTSHLTRQEIADLAEFVLSQ